jgi:hypothetical protein
MIRRYESLTWRVTPSARTRPCTGYGLIGAMSVEGQPGPGRANSRFNHVGFPLIAIEFCGAAEFRDVPITDVHSLTASGGRMVL